MTNRPLNPSINQPELRDFTLENKAGMRCRLINYGARVVEIWVPDRDGKLADVALGHDNLDDYITFPKTFFGATVGRVANRTAGAQFELEGQRYRLAANDGANHLHGGPTGFHTKFWKVESFDKTQLVFALQSPDGDEGYPGALSVRATYQLTDDNALQITYEANTDKPGPVNLTNHTYFNLNGDGNIKDAVFQIFADHYLPVRDDLTPTGTLKAVAGTPFDFRNPKVLSQNLDQSHHQLELANGFDHNFIPVGSGFRAFAKIWDPPSGRKLSVYSDAPGVQFYTGNALCDEYPGKGGKFYSSRSGFCLETQGFPNSLNQKNFPSIILTPGETYRHRCVYQFGV